MATSFKGWGSSFSGWGDGAVDPNAMQGSASFSVNATATLTAVSVSASRPEDPRYAIVGGMTVEHRKRLMAEDEVLLAILQMFVLEEA